MTLLLKAKIPSPGWSLANTYSACIKLRVQVLECASEHNGQRTLPPPLLCRRRAACEGVHHHLHGCSAGLGVDTHCHCTHHDRSWPPTSIIDRRSTRAVDDSVLQQPTPNNRLLPWELQRILGSSGDCMQKQTGHANWHTFLMMMIFDVKFTAFSFSDVRD